ncbi:MAG: radical SAM protein, partial [Deltaproteobacteria bacterium]|nr:radical SAM protein [Deltaproteobacteria bacterium]
MQQLMEAVPRLNDIATRCGLDSDDVQRALGRLWQAGSALAGQTGGLPADTSGRLVDGFTRNLDQDPMLIGWALRVASRLGETAWQRFFDNFVVRMVTERPALVARLRDELGMVPPMTLVVNPTMACNLRCRGCYAFEFSRSESMDPELFRRIVREARDMGIRFLTVTGGEPYAYKPLVDLAMEFPDMMFLTYTNGTLINDKMADRIAAAGNIMPALSVEG